MSGVVKKRILLCPGLDAHVLAATLSMELGSGFDVEAAGLSVEESLGGAGGVAAMLSAIEAAALSDSPDAVLIDGEGESTLVAALVFSKLQVPLARLGGGADGLSDASLAERLCDLLLCNDDAAHERASAAGLGGRSQVVGSIRDDPAPAAAAIASWLA